MFSRLASTTLLLVCAACEFSSGEQLRREFCDALLTCDAHDVDSPPEGIDSSALIKAQVDCYHTLKDQVDDGRLSWANIGRCEDCLANNECSQARERRDCDVACLDVPLAVNALTHWTEIGVTCSTFETACSPPESSCASDLANWRLINGYGSDGAISACAACVGTGPSPADGGVDYDTTARCDELTERCNAACAQAPILQDLFYAATEALSVCQADWACLKYDFDSDGGVASEPDNVADALDGGETVADASEGEALEERASGDEPAYQLKSQSACYEQLSRDAECRQCIALEGGDCARMTAQCPRHCLAYLREPIPPPEAAPRRPLVRGL